MRSVAAAFLLAALALTAVAPQAQAALNKPRHFEESFPFSAGLDNTAMTVVSGEVAATTQGTGSYGFFDTQGATISGLTRVCYSATCTLPGSYSLVVANGGSFALCFPAASAGRAHAGHGLSLFVDFAQDDDLNSFGVDKSLVIPAVDGSYKFTTIPPVNSNDQALSAPCSRYGGVTALDDKTTITVRGGASPVTLTGKNARVSFTGQASVTDVAAGFYILPFNAGSQAAFDRSSQGDAKEGLDLGRVQDLISKLDSAHANSNVQRQPSETGGGNTQELLAGLLNGALLRMPDAPEANKSISLDGSRFIRFSGLEVRSTSAGGLSWEGKAYLDIDDGKVAGAKPIVGFWLFQLPWWSYVLWAAAITLAIVRLVLRPAKDNPRWDGLRWVGWVATPVAWIIVFFLWDLEVRNVLGVSLLHGTSGQFRLIVGLLQVALLSLCVGFAAAAPLRVIGRNSFLLARQGTFMGLAGSIAAVLGFLLGAPYLRSYLGLILAKVMEKLG